MTLELTIKSRERIKKLKGKEDDGKKNILENLKLRIENERLKKGYQVKGGGANKEYVTLNDVNTKSLKH